MPTDADAPAVRPAKYLPEEGHCRFRRREDQFRLPTAGVLLLAGADKRIGLTDTLAGLIPDPRDQAQITHTMSDILRAG